MNAAVQERVHLRMLVERPRTRGECQGGVRPCPWVSCRYHLYLDVTRQGHIFRAFPELEVHELEETCALDLADRGGLGVREIGAYMGLSKSRVGQVFQEACDSFESELHHPAQKPHRNKARQSWGHTYESTWKGEK